MTPALAQAIDAGMMLRVAGGGAFEFGERRLHGLGVARARQAFSRSICSRSASSDTVRIASMPPVSGEGSRFEIAVDADDDLLAALDRFQPRRVGFDQPLLHVAGLDRGDRAAHLVDALELFHGLAL